MVKTIFMGQKNAGGGSTITQQLAKQLYSPSSEGLFQRALQKPIEWMIAVKLERFYSKDEIIKMYLNQFDFLYNAVGIKSAAYVYFGKDPKDLTVEEAATLVGMVKNPSYYNPVRKPERVRERRNVVLEQMYKEDMLSREELDSLKQLPLKLDFHRVDHKEGPAPYFREELRRILRAKKPERSAYRGWEKQKFIDDSIAWETNPLFGWIEKNPKPDGTKYDIYNDGLKIYTTIDSRMQRYAENAVNTHLSRTLQPAFFREKRNVKGAPYTTNREELSSSQLAALIDHSMKQSDRYIMMKKADAASEIKTAFNTPVDMKVFTYAGVIDTTLTPMDSILYNKHFLRSGFMSMDPMTGHVKAYVGGPDFRFFQYDMVSTGRRQIGSTIKPFLYTYAMEEGYTPCDEFLNEQPTIYDENGNPWSPRNAAAPVWAKWSTYAGRLPTQQLDLGPTDEPALARHTCAQHAQLRHHQPSRPGGVAVSRPVRCVGQGDGYGLLGVCQQRNARRPPVRDRDSRQQRQHHIGVYPASHRGHQPRSLLQDPVDSAQRGRRRYG